MALFRSRESSTVGVAPDASPSPSTARAEADCRLVVERLAAEGAASAAVLEEVLAIAAGRPVKLAEELIARGVVRQLVSAAIAGVWDVPIADTRSLVAQPDALVAVPEPVAREHRVVPLRIVDGVLWVVTADPSPANRAAVEQAVTGTVAWSVADPGTVHSLLDRHYRADADIERLVRSFDTAATQVRLVDDADAGDDQGPVVQLVNRIIGQALRDRASDLHIEPLDDRLRIRFRIDGRLVEAFDLPLTVHPPLVSRLKIMSSMNIVEKRRPQDGQFSTVVDGREVDVRVATVATIFGERMVMRILDRQRSMIGLDQLGFSRETYLHYSKMIRAPFGMVICAGPTGAGKTTTLYATLLELDAAGANITTIEDPVEYVFPGVNQIQTNEQAGITFASGLKAVLRQDPDAILVGEIRDADTARIAVQSALTGHFVVSSLHSTDSVAALHRLLDMGIEAFLVASAVMGVVGQRLLRRVCDGCAEPYSPPADELAVFRQHSGGSEKSVFVRGTGCPMCAGTGYRDRIGVYELLRITPEIRRLVVGWATTEELRRLAVAQGMRTMAREAMALVESDVTTIPEVIRTLLAG